MSPEAPRVRADSPSALPDGTRLGEFELLKVIGVGGFGIVYLAFDHALEREVAVKEYMPASLAGRTETMHVSLRSQSDAETFELGRRSFVNEAKLLARFDHPSLLKVHRFWEANGTAYMAMPVMRGRTVKDVRADMEVPPNEGWLRALLDPLLGAIEKLHSEGVYHRDIAPDNIQIELDGRPVLLDFGAARRVISDKSQTLTAILKPAYAPIEQYAELGAVKQGPWTDLYALGATLHYLLLQRPPAPATARAVHDEPSELTLANCPGCSERFLHTVDWMLAPRPTDRPQSVAQLRDVLDGRRGPPVRHQQEAPTYWDRTQVLAPATQHLDLPLDQDVTVVMPRAPGGSVVVPPRPTVPPPPLTPTQAMPMSGPAAAVPPSWAPPPPDTVPTPLAEPAQPAASAMPSFAAPPVSGSLAAAPAPAVRGRLVPVALGAAVVALAVAGAMAFWPRQADAPAVDLAASAAAPAMVASAATEVPPPPAAASAVPESAITTVVVVPTPVRAEARPAATRTMPGARVAAVAPEPETVPAPVVEPPKPVQASAPAAVPAPVPVAVAELPKPVAGPEARCAGRNFIMHFACMERECLRSQFLDHADCKEWRKQARSE